MSLAWLQGCGCENHPTPTPTPTGTPAGSGPVYFQAGNTPDLTYYPLPAAAGRTSATNQLKAAAPLRTRSWLGGLLWGTGESEDNYWTWNKGTSQWESPVFRQGILIGDPVMLSYESPPNAQNSQAVARGMNVCLPYPYLKPDTPYAGIPGYTRSPLSLHADALHTVRFLPTQQEPPVTGAFVPAYSPVNILVDRMGDWDVDLLYQNPDNSSQYLKITAAQGSPFVWVESMGNAYAGFQNWISASSNEYKPEIGLIGPGTVPGTNGKIQYAIIYGNQWDPSQYSENDTLNPPGLQDNWTFFAVYWNSDEATFHAGNENDWLTWGTDQNPYQAGKKYWFVIGALPTRSYYPHVALAPADKTALFNAKDTYAQTLGQYAFNFITNTQITYAVTNNYLVNTTFTATLNNPYGAGTSLPNATVFALSPHQYEKVTLGKTPDGTAVAPDVLNMLNAQNFAPNGPNDDPYWTVRGNLKTIAGNQFQTVYVFNNFLPCNPPLQQWDEIFTSPAGFSRGVGQFIFDITEWYFINYNDVNFAPWGTAYLTLNKGLYDVGKTLSSIGYTNGLLQQFWQYNKKYPEAAYNNIGILTPNRPGNPDNPTSLLNALQDNVGSLNTASDDPKTNLKNSIGMKSIYYGYFTQTPIQSDDPKYHLLHFAHYDETAQTVNLFVTGADPDMSLAYPSSVNNPPVHNNLPGSLYQAWGESTMINDHHYQYGYWIAGAALLAMYDGAWNGQLGDWAGGAQYGQAIDQLVMDIAYDPAITDWYKTKDILGNDMIFPKLQFFDQWAGHGWADGLQGTLAGGNEGHNENSCGEALQGYASVALWGMATNRKSVTDLGIYLYATASQANDVYFLDKILHYKPGGTHFVPTVTQVGNASYPLGTSMWDTIIKDPAGNSSGVCKVSQNALHFTTDFGQTPMNQMFIQAFPFTPWTMSLVRNPDYMNSWCKAMTTAQFTSTVTEQNSGTFNISYAPNMNMIAALCGSNAVATADPAETPTQWYLRRMLKADPNTNPPPWSGNEAYIDASQTFSSVLHTMHTGDDYGNPDWTVYAMADSDAVRFFSAAYYNPATKKTTYCAFNPTNQPINVTFYRLGTTTPALAQFPAIAPKNWAIITQ